MSIASNVIGENNRLGTARTLMRQKLTANSIYYSNSDSVIQLVRRWNLIYADISFNTPSSDDIYSGVEVIYNSENGLNEILYLDSHGHKVKYGMSGF